MRTPSALVWIAGLSLSLGACSKNVGTPGQAPAGAAKPKARKMGNPHGNALRRSMMRKRGKLPPGHPPMGAHGPKLAWKLPAGWSSVKPRTRMRRAEFVLPGKDGVAEGRIAVFHFPGQGGSVMGNIQRWVGQFKPPGDGKAKAEIVDRSSKGLKITRVRYSGTYMQAKRPMMMKGPSKAMDDYALLAAIVQTPRGPWFFKGIGPKKTLDAHLSAFDAFLGSLSLKGAKPAAKPAPPAKAADKKAAAADEKPADKKPADKKPAK